MIDIQPVHRRRAPRHAVALECECFRESGMLRTTQLLLDLSAEGAFIQSDAWDVELGEEVWLHFYVPNYDARMYARAKVVRFGQEWFLGDHVQGLGVEFVDLDLAEHHRLERLLSSLPPPVPTATRPVDYASFVRLIDDGVA